ncbi:hypothetical protein BKA69DRAFT_1127179 [Paraphysoderma sedebokerense]|nr:hypothetical protein BKA69DRAFT_1127179 [Paraphysoderma sedebokerense]
MSILKALSLTILFLSFTVEAQFGFECPRILNATDVPPDYNLNTTFYKKYLPGPGAMRDIPILASDKVSDEALYRAWYVLDRMCSTVEPDVWKNIANVKIRVGIMARTELTVDIPEHSDLTPAQFWNERARGLGATDIRPAITAGEENLLLLPLGDVPNDRYNGECILVHEFAHTIHQYGMNSMFDMNLQQVFGRSMARGLWDQTYATTNHMEYWAEVVQSYFNCNRQSSRGDIPDGVHGNITTRERLRSYDPEAYTLVDTVFKGNPWIYQLPQTEVQICRVGTTSSSRSSTSTPSSTSTQSSIPSETAPPRDNRRGDRPDINSAPGYLNIATFLALIPLILAVRYF